jgi:purine-binding chemotaxis protein CheW
MNPSGQDAFVEVLVFQLDGRRYGLLAEVVREVLRAVAVVLLPRAPAIVEGVINLRGRIVPVLDLRRRFRLPPRPLYPSDHLIVASADERLVVLRVDQATDLVRLPASHLEEASGVVPGVEYVRWVARVPDDLVLLHDLRTFLSQAEAETLAAALDEMAPSQEGAGAP